MKTFAQKQVQRKQTRDYLTLLTEHRRLKVALLDAVTRMERARRVLKSDNANWGMLDTDDLQKIRSQTT